MLYKPWPQIVEDQSLNSIQLGGPIHRYSLYGLNISRNCPRQPINSMLGPIQIPNATGAAIPTECDHMRNLIQDVQLVEGHVTFFIVSM